MAQLKQISFNDALGLINVRVEIKALQDLEKQLRKEIASCFDDELVVEKVNIEGLEVHKYWNGINSQSLDTTKAFELISKKRIKGLAIKKVELIDENGLKMALEQGKLTLEEYNSLYSSHPTMNIKVTDKREEAEIKKSAIA